MHILIKNLLKEKKGIGSITKGFLLILLALTICTCSGPRLMLGDQTLEKQIDYSLFIGKRVKQIDGVMECAISRIDVQVFRLWHPQRQLTWLPYLPMHGTEYLSKSGADAKKMFTDKVVPISINYPFFFRPIQDGMDRPKTELAYRVPASKFTRKRFESKDRAQEIAGLDTTIDWKNTGDNSYDGEKLALLVHDEAGKWERPENILNNWRVTKTTLRLGSRIIGKCMMGSTINALDKGGENFKKLYNNSDVTKRNKNGQTRSGLYSLFIPMEWNFEGFIDSYGIPVFNTPKSLSKTTREIISTSGLLNIGRMK